MNTYNRLLFFKANLIEIKKKCERKILIIRIVLSISLLGIGIFSLFIGDQLTVMLSTGTLGSIVIFLLLYSKYIFGNKCTNEVEELISEMQEEIDNKLKSDK